MHPTPGTATAPTHPVPAPPGPDTLPWAGLRLGQAEGILTLGDANTTVAYCRFAEDGEVEYLFVASPWRRRGLACWLLGQVASLTGQRLRFRGPLSPQGRGLVEAWSRMQPG